MGAPGRHRPWALAQRCPRGCIQEPKVGIEYAGDRRGARLRIRVTVWQVAPALCAVAALSMGYRHAAASSPGTPRSITDAQELLEADRHDAGGVSLRDQRDRTGDQIEQPRSRMSQCRADLVVRSGAPSGRRAPHRRASALSPDPQCLDQGLRDVAGLYLNPPDAAGCASAWPRHETQIQALVGRPRSPRRCGHDAEASPPARRTTTSVTARRTLARLHRSGRSRDRVITEADPPAPGSDEFHRFPPCASVIVRGVPVNAACMSVARQRLRAPQSAGATCQRWPMRNRSPRDHLAFHADLQLLDEPRASAGQSLGQQVGSGAPTHHSVSLILDPLSGRS